MKVSIKKKFIITKFQCSKCLKEHKWNLATEQLETDCNCGWIYLKGIQGIWKKVLEKEELSK